MSLRLMLDENMSYVVAEQVRQKRSDVIIESVYTWRAGAYLGAQDAELIAALHEKDWLLVTYDTQILAEQPFLFDGTLPFSGILFVDERTIAPKDFGGLVRSLTAFWTAHHTEDWTGRMGYLRRS